MKKQRKHYTPEEKVAILRRHLLDKEPVSKLCDEVGLKPTVLYRWQKEFFENGAAAFDQRRPTNQSADQERIAHLQKKIQTTDEVLAGGVGEASHRRVPSEEPVGGLTTADLQDARCGHRVGQSVQRVARSQPGRIVIEVEGQAVEEGHRLPATAGRSSALAHRRSSS